MYSNMKTILIGLSLAVTAMSAAIDIRNPEDQIQPTEMALEKGDVSIQALTTFLVCKNVNFSNCADAVVNEGTCVNLSSSWNDIIKSCRASTGHRCYIYEDFGCQGNRGGPVYNDQQHSDLSVWGWSNRASSVWCELV